MSLVTRITVHSIIIWYGIRYGPAQYNDFVHLIGLTCEDIQIKIQILARDGKRNVTIGTKKEQYAAGIAAAIAALYGFIRLPETHHKYQPVPPAVQQNNIVPKNLVMSNPVANPILAATGANSSQLSTADSDGRNVQERRRSGHHVSAAAAPYLLPWASLLNEGIHHWLPTNKSILIIWFFW